LNYLRRGICFRPVRWVTLRVTIREPWASMVVPKRAATNFPEASGS
jgi:hypothetical protein